MRVSDPAEWERFRRSPGVGWKYDPGYSLQDVALPAARSGIPDQASGRERGTVTKLNHAVGDVSGRFAAGISASGATCCSGDSGGLFCREAESADPRRALARRPVLPKLRRGAK
ncbi:hypothetical protein FHU36_003443 [Nonomuraea muscovyensis]|uniref:Uncharacterized protein n=1 Tax=Nonomuraea muscovyensis TaxID=1124761 RepID=A0A7X0C2E5_9ACTN|nr:hypothetical protein [Nonomuraea muscovyensis]MBB6346898.1 hypothetical protein [Nonomuraea muscovyensis]